MAFGITRKELADWKKSVSNGEIAFLTHFWKDDRFPSVNSVTKVGCYDIEKLISWGETFDLKKEWIHYYKQYPHFDLLGDKQREILEYYNLEDQMKRFYIKKNIV
ncbi:hypothetical protein [Bacillus weihaiensis]|uniref:Uncharacterized protein n=1 Tax=Bacillus weihaiensis TaxID=1547283 RepID=A0A1L3MRY3_9BACI|nr:hypothetical protein [Bacillus weihaiensis]APH05099.1 hypothetical protein A9C19_10245 [Bacillus weihaiensis]